MDRDTILSALREKLPFGFSLFCEEDGSLWVRKDGTFGSESNFWNIGEITDRGALEYVAGYPLSSSLAEAGAALDVSHIPMEAVLRATALWRIELVIDTGTARMADHHLIAMTGCTPEEAYWAMQLCCGLGGAFPESVEYGATVRTGWLTEEGMNRLYEIDPEMSELHEAAYLYAEPLTAHQLATYATAITRLHVHAVGED